MPQHRWLYIPDLESPTGWRSHDATHGEDEPPDVLADAVGFHWIRPVELEDVDDRVDKEPDTR